ncbi:hypothetical protein PENSTE_c016G06045 [Penicillium steckii]|uniref:Uncharacterized protein n=1 Tax=Penicillium steckii TaxID=303698 RepID=A0A1V6SYS7_9EURO|nr:hypothetical protein PENSTE_c016G06045 [Penicillium steckii]
MMRRSQHPSEPSHRSGYSKKERIQQLEHEGNVKDGQIASLQEDNQRIYAQLKAAETEIKEFRIIQMQTNDAPRKVQASVFESQDQPQWSLDSDDKIRQQLKGLEGEVKAWCRNSSVKSLDMAIEAMQGKIPSEWNAVLRYDGKLLARNDQHFPPLLLQALLTDCIYSNIFANPFFFLQWRTKIAQADKSTASATEDLDRQNLIEVILQEILQGNPVESHSWRCQLLRLLDPKVKEDEGESPQLQLTREKTQQARERAAKYFTDLFLDSSARYLIFFNPENMVSQEDLKQIFLNAAHLSYKLWLRKCYVEVQGIGSLPHVYRHDLKHILKAHALHNAYLDRDEKGLDDTLVRLVVHPALIVHGSSDGTNYESSRIWKEAVVWMGPRDIISRVQEKIWLP